MAVAGSGDSVARAVHAALRLGLELPPLSAAQRDGPRALGDLALGAERAGLGALWLCEGPRGCIDPVPLAGAIAELTSSLGVGVLVRPSHGRHPAVVARDITTIDRLSGGRAALGLLEDGLAPSDLERLAEALATVHRLLTETEVTMVGRFYEVAELTTRPRPTAPSGPPVLGGLLDGARADALGERARLGAGVDGLVVGGSEADVARARRRVDGLAGAGALPALLWRGALPEDAEGARAAGAALVRAGADGLLVTLDSSPGGAPSLGPEAARRLEVLAELVRPR